MTPSTKVLHLSSVDLMLLSKYPVGSLWTCTALFSSLLYSCYLHMVLPKTMGICLACQHHEHLLALTMLLVIFFLISLFCVKALCVHTKANTNNYESSSRRYICKCKYSMTHTNISENDYTETEQSVMNWDETTFVKGH